MRAKYSKSLKAGLLTAALIAAGWVGDAGPARAQSFVKAGVLTCSVSGGVGLILTSTKALSCTFASDLRAPERYTGSIRKFGLDIGVTGEAVIVWVVLSAVEGLPVGALAGSYGGVSAEASVIVGAGANALLGGSDRSIALQPLSVQAQVGLNVAAGIARLELVHQ